MYSFTMPLLVLLSTFASLAAAGMFDGASHIDFCKEVRRRVKSNYVFYLGTCCTHILHCTDYNLTFTNEFNTEWVYFDLGPECLNDPREKVSMKWDWDRRNPTRGDGPDRDVLVTFPDEMSFYADLGYVVYDNHGKYRDHGIRYQFDPKVENEKICEVMFFKKPKIKKP